MRAVILLCIAMCTMVYADVYFHNIRGSNNRLKGQNRNRDNAYRMFDSQNNDRGGYNVGPTPMYFYTGSILTLEWTNQHQCGGPNANCDLILQYMCSENLRDGLEERTIPERNKDCKDDDCNTDIRYGMHEDYDYYMNCKNRQRNPGLFLADQELEGTSAKYTRQNPDGDRYGYECPEERDHYPYWLPTPWIDIAIMTRDLRRCNYYRENSQNNNAKYYCKPPQKYLDELKKRDPPSNLPRIPISQDDCERFHYPANDKTDRGVWTRHDSWNVDPPECIAAPPSRDNHNGNGEDGYFNSYNFTIPNAPHKNCAIRIRYNISTSDYDVNLDADGNGDPARAINIHDLVGIDTKKEATERGYVFKDYPKVYPMKGEIGKKLGLALAINTAQYFRTFEDRSHRTSFKARTPELEGVEIRNLNVKGKRGNIVQVYPAVEYGFVPDRMLAEVGDMIHIQWTGSDRNPRNNDGEGPAGEDRSNIAELDQPRVAQVVADYNEYGDLTRSYPAHLDNATFLGLSRDELISLALAKGDCEFDRQGARSRTPYFDMGPVALTKKGIYNYLCTINNNFTNRSQKGTAIITEKSKAGGGSKATASASKSASFRSVNGKDQEKRKYHAYNYFEQYKKK